MKFIFSTGSLYTYGTERCFGMAAVAGFDGIELMADHRWDTRQSDYVNDLIQRTGLPVLALHSPFSPVPGWPSDQPAIIALSVRLAEAISAPVVIHHLPMKTRRLTLTLGHGKRFSTPMPFGELELEYRKWLENDYRRLQDSTDVLLCIENMPAHKYFRLKWNAYQWNAHSLDQLGAITQFPHLTMDTTHLATWGLEAVQVYAEWKEKVKHVHLSNYDGREHRRPETGRVKLDELLFAMARENYQRSISLELHPDALDEGAADERVIELMATSLSHCRRWATGE